jgi:hypothetical protein
MPATVQTMLRKRVPAVRRAGTILAIPLIDLIASAPAEP